MKQISGAQAWQFGLWVRGAIKRRRERQRLEQQIEQVERTGLPKDDTAIGEMAREFLDEQQRNLDAPPPVHGSARWGTRADATDVIGKAPGRELFLGQLIEGDADTGVPIVARYPGHILTVAGTGQGKSATQIVANLRTYQGSVVVIDPKGELYDLTHAHRRQFNKVYRLAPLAKPHEPRSHCYNPLAELNVDGELGIRARRLAEMLMVRQGDKGAADAAFFENEAINLLTAVIMYVVELEEHFESGIGDLAEVCRILTLPWTTPEPPKANPGEKQERKAETFPDVLQAMQSPKMNPKVRAQGAIFSGYDRKLLSSFLSEINSNLSFFGDHIGFSRATCRSDFFFEDLALEPTTVYLTIPLKDLPTSYRFLRMMVGQAFSALEEQREARDAAVLFVMDEFPALKELSFMKDAVPQMRSAGAWFWFFVQDVAQLEAVYGQWANVFLSQTDYQVFFGAVSDQRTREYLSEMLGKTTYAYKNPNVSWAHSVGNNNGDSQGMGQSGSYSDGRNLGQSVNVDASLVLSERDLMTPTEVATFLAQRLPGQSHSSTAIMLSKAANGYPLKLRRVHWNRFKLTERSPQQGRPSPPLLLTVDKPKVG